VFLQIDDSLVEIDLRSGARRTIFPTVPAS